MPKLHLKISNISRELRQVVGPRVNRRGEGTGRYPKCVGHLIRCEPDRARKYYMDSSETGGIFVLSESDGRDAALSTPAP